MRILFKNLFLSPSLIDSVRQQNRKLIRLITIVALSGLNMILLASIWKCLILNSYLFLAFVACLFCISFFSLVLIRKRDHILFGYIAIYGSLILLWASELYSIQIGLYVEQRLLFSGIVLILYVFMAGMVINPKHVLYVGIYSIIRLLFCAVMFKTGFIVDIFPYYFILQVGVVIGAYIIQRALYIFSYQSLVNSKLIDKENKDLNQLMSLKQDMVSMILHDIRNPLNAILFASQEKRLPDQVCTSVQHILDLADNFIDVHRMEENRFLIHPGYEHVNQTIHGAIEQVDYLLHEKNNWVRLYEVASLQLNADHRLMERVFVNILTNSIKHSLPNTPVIIRSVFLLDHIRFEISNNGDSIPPEEVQTIFDKYVSNDQLLKKNDTSKGLGLHFCKMVVEAHGGNIGMDTNFPKRGVSTWFTLPYQNKPASMVVLEQDIVSPLRLDPEEKEIIRPFRIRINQNEIFEISRIMLILDELTAPAYPNVELWKTELLNAVLIGNNEYYTVLMAMVG